MCALAASAGLAGSRTQSTSCSYPVRQPVGRSRRLAYVRNDVRASANQPNKVVSISQQEQAPAQSSGPPMPALAAGGVALLAAAAFVMKKMRKSG